LAAVLRTVLCFYSRIREALTCPRIFTTPKDIDISRWSRSQTHFCACWRSVIHWDRCPRGSCWIQDKEVAQMILPSCLLCQVMSKIVKLGSAVIRQSMNRNLMIKGIFHVSSLAITCPFLQSHVLDVSRRIITASTNRVLRFQKL
jgi:hypothetical protein